LKSLADQKTKRTTVRLISYIQKISGAQLSELLEDCQNPIRRRKLIHRPRPIIMYSMI